jgi:hypothetical protein
LHFLACTWYYVSHNSGPEGGPNFLSNKNMIPAYDGYGSMYHSNRTETDMLYSKDNEKLLTFFHPNNL